MGSVQLPPSARLTARSARTHAVAAFDYDAETGDIRNRRVVIEVPSDHGLPDGMTIDTEDMLWVGHWGGSRVQRWDPRTGKVLKVIKLPVSQVTSCTFAGPNLDKLYITTAHEGMTAEQRAKERLAGGVFVCDNPGARGYAAVEFAG
jgi:sugar lactone lactonase YvrE